MIAISSRSVAAAGCPGGRAIAFHLPAGAPRMEGRVIFNPGAPFAVDAATETEADFTVSTRSRATTQVADQSSSPRARRQAVEGNETTSGKDKTTTKIKNASKSTKKGRGGKKGKGRRKG